MDARFSYSKLIQSINRFSGSVSANEESRFKTKILAKTVLGHNIYLIAIGNGSKKLFLSAAFHGMEDITSRILMYFSEKALKLYKKNSEKIVRLLDDITIYIVPMVNPDGVSISLNEIEPDNEVYSSILTINNGNSDFTKWQANANGVDINHNFDADWHLSRSFEKKHGIFGPSPTRYAGEFPESEIESRALVKLTRENSFDLVIAFHSQGEEIYYSFGNELPKFSLTLAKEFERASGYRAEAPSGIAAFGGYKDWFIKEFKRPGFTIEVGLGENPLPPQQFELIYPKAEAIIFSAMEFLSGGGRFCTATPLP